MFGSIDAGFDAIELDLGLTQNGVPVLSHDPWLHESLCTTVDGDPLEGRVLLRDHNLARLQSLWLCGGVPDPEFVNAEVVAEPVMTLDELLAALPLSEAHMWVHLDVKYEPGQTASPSEFATQILDRWIAADLPNPMYVSANTPEVLRAFESDAHSRGREVNTSLIWPKFPPETSSTAVALNLELGLIAGLVDPVAEALDAGADGIALYHELARREDVVTAHAEGLEVGLWTLNEPGLMDSYSRWPIDAVITDYPGDGS